MYKRKPSDAEAQKLYTTHPPTHPQPSLSLSLLN